MTDIDYRTFEPSELEDAFKYIFAYWKKSVRFQPEDDGTLIGLPGPYIVPTADVKKGFTYNEMFYWDSYFIALGLYGTAYQRYAQSMLGNLAYMVKKFGMIPNSSRSYMLGRSQPPFLTSFIMDVYLSRKIKDKLWLRRMMKIARKEYDKVWMADVQPNDRRVFEGLSRYYDINYLHDLAEAESGWDMTNRFGRKALNYVPVDLNSLLFRYERDFARYYEMRGKGRKVKHWLDVSDKRREAVNKYMWNDKKGFYFDYNYVTGRRSKVWSLAGFYPLWSGLASPEQAEKVVQNLDKFEFDGGLVTTAELPSPKSRLPLQWGYPNGWAPLQLIAIYGLDNYGYNKRAQRLARKWIGNCLDIYKRDGVFQEKYNVVEPGKPPLAGVYPDQVGFGWSNAVFYRLCKDFLWQEELPKLRTDKTPQDITDEFFGNAEQYARRFAARVRRPFDP